MADPKADHQPVQEEYREAMNDLARSVDRAINPDGVKRNGFALFLFRLGEPTAESRVNYISNAAREDMLAAMKEFIARAEGRYHGGK